MLSLDVWSVEIYDLNIYFHNFRICLQIHFTNNWRSHLTTKYFQDLHYHLLDHLQIERSHQLTPLFPHQLLLWFSCFQVRSSSYCFTFLFILSWHCCTCMRLPGHCLSDERIWLCSLDHNPSWQIWYSIMNIPILLVGSNQWPKPIIVYRIFSFWL